MPKLLRLAAILAAAALLCGMQSVASADDADNGVGDSFGISDLRITESSGLAASPTHAHTVWTANDSGDTARIFALDTRTGDVVGVHKYGVEVRDVEAMAVGPRHELYIGDIGDNASARRHIRVHVMADPPLGDTRGRPARTYQLVYPDGPHNAEALLVNPKTGRMFIVTKASPGIVYEAPESLSTAHDNRLKRIGEAPAIVTDGVFLPGGKQLVLRTYRSVYLIDAATWSVIAASEPSPQPQSETIALNPGSRDTVLVGSEGAASVVFPVPVPTKPAAVLGPDGTEVVPQPDPSPISWGVAMVALLAAAIYLVVSTRRSAKRRREAA